MPVRVGIIGAGQAGRHHALAILSSRRAQVAWVADPVRERGEELAALTGARCVPDYSALLADADAVSVCAPHALLAEIAVTAARAGLHVLVEKPMATNLEDADRVLAAARQARIQLMVGYVHRYRPEAQKAFGLIAAGAIGEPRFITDRSVGGGTRAWPPWVRTVASGGGLLLYSGVHRIDRARWLFGREVATVFGSTQALIPGADVESSSAALLGFQGGGRAALTHHHHAVDLPFDWETDVHGTDGLIRIRIGNGIDVVDRKGSRHESSGPEHHFNAEIEAFLDAIEGSETLIPSGEDGRAVLAVALAVGTSQVAGLPVTPAALGVR